MLTNDDKKEIRKIMDESTQAMRSSLVDIEGKVGLLADIWEFIKSHTEQLKDHEERISNIESSQNL